MLFATFGLIVLLGKWIRKNLFPRENIDVVTISASHHCCGIYEMQGVHFEDPTKQDLKALINRTHWDSQSSRIIQFSDTKYGNGNKWMDYIISKGYQVDKFDLGANPKTGNRIYLYHWYLTPKDSKISLVREYAYEEKQKEPESDKSGVSSGKGILRDCLGRFRSRNLSS